MRIRQVRPEFFTDATMASLPPAVRLTYIGLWCVADDAGWLRWDVADIGAQLFPFETMKVRERHLSQALERLCERGRIVLHPCGCAHIEHLVDHQKIGGNHSYAARDAHLKHGSTDASGPVRTGMDESAGMLGNGTLGKGSPALARNDEETYRRSLAAANRRLGLPVPDEVIH